MNTPRIRELDKITDYQREFLTGLDFDFNRAEIIAHQLNTELSLLSEGSKEYTEKKQKLTRSLNIIRNIKNGICDAHRTNGRRIMSDFTNMRKVLRTCYNSNGHVLVEVDCANSHPLLLVSKLIKEGYDIEPEIIKSVANGTFYDYIPLSPEHNVNNRDDKKRECFRVFYHIKEFGINKELYFYKIMDQVAPKFLKAVVEVSEAMGGKSLAAQMQREESYIWIDLVSRALFYYNIPHATAHDGLAFEPYQDNIRIVYDTVMRAFETAGLSAVITLNELTVEETPVEFNRADRLTEGELSGFNCAVAEKGIDEHKRVAFNINPDNLIENNVPYKDALRRALSKHWKVFNDFYLIENKKPTKADLDRGEWLEPKIDIKKEWVATYLNRKGFRRRGSDRTTQYFRIVDNIIEEVNAPLIRQFLIDSIKNSKNQVIGGVKKSAITTMAGEIRYNEEVVFSYLNNIEPELERVVKNTTNAAFFPFKNGVLKVTSGVKELINYTDFKYLVWKPNIIDINYTDIVGDILAESQIGQFLWKISGDVIDGNEAITQEVYDKKMNVMKNLIKGLGFLSHGYKDIAKPLMLLVQDTEVFEETTGRGGSGKTLFSTLPQLLRSIAIVDGKMDNKEWQFSTMPVTTNVVVIDDMSRFYSIEKLNSLVTSDFVINTKGGNIISLPFSDSPIIVGTSNYAVDTHYHGNRRVCSVELNNHFGVHNYLPDTFNFEIGTWDNERRLLEINYLIYCVQYKLAYGLPKTIIENETQKILQTKLGANKLEALDFVISDCFGFVHSTFIMERVYDYMGSPIRDNFGGRSFIDQKESQKFYKQLQIYMRTKYPNVKKSRYHSINGWDFPEKIMLGRAG